MKEERDGGMDCDGREDRADPCTDSEGKEGKSVKWSGIRQPLRRDDRDVLRKESKNLLSGLWRLGEESATIAAALVVYYVLPEILQPLLRIMRRICVRPSTRYMCIAKFNPCTETKSFGSIL